MNDSVIANMHDRVEMCRRLAKSVTDQFAIEALRKMADEIEADVRQLEGNAGSASEGA